MRPTIAAADTVRTLIAAIPDDRLRELFLELALAALAVPAVEEPKPARATDDAVGAAAKAGVTARASTRSTATAVPISTRSTPSDASSVASHVKRRRPPARPNAAAASRRATAPRLRQWRHRLRRGAVGARPQARAAAALEGRSA